MRYHKDGDDLVWGMGVTEGRPGPASMSLKPSDAGSAPFQGFLLAPLPILPSFPFTVLSPFFFHSFPSFSSHEHFSNASSRQVWADTPGTAPPAPKLRVTGRGRHAGWVPPADAAQMPRGRAERAMEPRESMDPQGQLEKKRPVLHLGPQGPSVSTNRRWGVANLRRADLVSGVQCPPEFMFTQDLRMGPDLELGLLQVEFMKALNIKSPWVWVSF